jgi:hypothetical protein
MTRTELVSTPESYFDASSQYRMALKRQQAEHKWIFDLLAGVAEDEEVYIDSPEWMLCRDRHPGPEERFLVVFKDTSLYTIRDLNDTHVPLLVHVQQECRRFLLACAHRLGPRQKPGGPEPWRLYFNYMPSVLQLHLHVSRTTPHCSSRVQPLACVVRNLRANPGHYRTCLMLTGYTTRQYESRGERMSKAVRTGGERPPGLDMSAEDIEPARGRGCIAGPGVDSAAAICCRQRCRESSWTTLSRKQRTKSFTLERRCAQGI